MKFTVSIPATTANLGPGFDVWGLALNLRNEFTCTLLEEKEESILEFSFSDLVNSSSNVNPESQLETGSRNIIFKSYNQLFEKAGVNPPHIHVKAKIGVPIARGLGSSSTAILAGLVMANEILRHRYKKSFEYDQLFNLAVEIEGHPDNLAPALWGGFVLPVKSEESRSYTKLHLDFKAPVQLAGLIPHYSLNTERARQLLPEKVPLYVVSFQASRTALLSNLASRENWQKSDFSLLKVAMQDKVHQEQRAEMIPGMLETFDYWKSIGCVGSFLSGAGPVLLGFWHKDVNASEKHLSKVFDEKSVPCTTFYPKIDRTGLTVTFED